MLIAGSLSPPVTSERESPVLEQVCAVDSSTMVHACSREKPELAPSYGKSSIYWLSNERDRSHSASVVAPLLPAAASSLSAALLGSVSVMDSMVVMQ